tara:strand:+ start:195 stop:764 length:570 start_codon:yes stop_codon:yes gene_type:complete
MSKLKTLSSEQTNQLIASGLPQELLTALTYEQLLELLEKAEKESLVIKVKKGRNNICKDIVATFNNAPMVYFTETKLIELINILNQDNFFSIQYNGETFKLTNTATVKAFMLLKDYKFTNLLDNAQTKVCVDEKSKVNVSVGKWLIRGKAILKSELLKVGHAKNFNAYNLGYKLDRVEGMSNEYTFTKI